MTSYRPEHYTFRFPNAFVNQVWSGRIPPFIGRKYQLKTSGRCGGMVFASLDFFHVGTPVPAVESRHFAPETTPPDGHPLADYIYQRQLHSMLTSPHGAHNGLRFLLWSGFEAKKLRAKTRDEEAKAVNALDRGEPIVLGLIKATSRGLRAQGVNHQVICYGYRTADSGHREFLVYDPNEPFRVSASKPYEVVLRRLEHAEDTDYPYQVIRPNTVDEWRGFFVQQYRPRSPERRVINSTAP